MGSWKSVAAEQLLAEESQTLIAVNADTPVELACQTLIERQISSAPVWDDQTQSYVGLIDFRDIVSLLLLGIRKDIMMDSDSKPVQAIVAAAQAEQSIPVRLATDLSSRNPLHRVQPAAPFMDLIRVFGSGIHRILVIEDGEAVQARGLVSQMTGIKYIWAHYEEHAALTELFGKTIKDLKLGTKSIMSVGTNTKVVDALTIMIKQEVTSLAVVDNLGALVSSIDMNDVKFIVKSAKFHLLHGSVLQLVQFIEQQHGIADGKDMAPTFDVTESTPLRQVVAKLVATKTHRIWVVEHARGRPTSVISLTDLYRLFMASE
ncbi:hypothetical protein BC831DRAFT_457344 [Entophlyctis helioformis]|nr:hypothetical protein BC831DRAFT_457344 [Entophlyctis helioformis]